MPMDNSIDPPLRYISEATVEEVKTVVTSMATAEVEATTATTGEGVKTITGEEVTTTTGEVAVVVVINQEVVAAGEQVKSIRQIRTSIPTNFRIQITQTT